MSTTEHATDYRKYLDPKTLARISSLDLRARLIVEGLMTGMHRSPYQGISVEFAQHRPYVQGDDFRHIDWKVYGKTDKIYLKQYLEETNLHLICILIPHRSIPHRFAGIDDADQVKIRLLQILLEINLVGLPINFPIDMPNIIPLHIRPMLRKLHRDALIRRSMHPGHQPFNDQPRPQIQRRNPRQGLGIQILSIIG